MIAVDQDSLGMGGKTLINIGEIEVWKRPLVSGDIAIAIFNHANRDMRPVISWKALGLAETYAVRDLWAHEDRGKTTGSFSEPVTSHGVIMLRLTKAR